MRIALTNTHTLHFTSPDSLIQPLTHYLTYCQTTMKNNFVFFKFLSYCFFAVATTYLLLLLRCSLLHTQTLTHTHSRTYAAITRVDGRQKQQQQQSHLLMLHSPSPWGWTTVHSFDTEKCTQERERESAESESSARLSETHKKLTFSRRADDVTRLRLQLGCFYMCVSKRASHIHTHTHIYI